uniref:Uncharacterized protein n=1 Tax=Cannabis sativa TaxID=3483 RepID=A0A803QD55_CANSA
MTAMVMMKQESLPFNSKFKSLLWGYHSRGSECTLISKINLGNPPQSLGMTKHEILKLMEGLRDAVIARGKAQDIWVSFDNREGPLGGVDSRTPLNRNRILRHLNYSEPNCRVQKRIRRERMLVSILLDPNKIRSYDPM